MKVTVLNGSPKGDLSVTLQYVKFIGKKFPDNEYEYINISQRINKIEDDPDLFSEITGIISASDLIIWSVPLYVMLVPSQYKRFIELIWERNIEGVFRGKYAAVITTSIHFFDNTAHNYMRGICDDLGMVFAGAFSPDMYDIMQEDGRTKLLQFAASCFETTTKKIVTPRVYDSPDYDMPVYEPGDGQVKTQTGGKRVLILSDKRYINDNMGNMITRLSTAFQGDVRVMTLTDVDIRGGCLGCCECGLDYRCVYTAKDGFIDFYNNEILTSDIIIYAGNIKDRYLSAKWKQAFDRCFFNTHTPTLRGKQIAFLLSGPLRRIANLREILQAFAEWQHANLAGIVTDEQDSATTDKLIDSLAAGMVAFSGEGYVAAPTFLGVGGMKIFRDDIWGRLRFVFQADHKFYEENGYYDFPQEDKKTMEINEKMIALTNNPDMRENVRKMIKTEMVKPMKHIVETK